MKRGTRAWHDPRTGLHGGTGEDTLVVCSPSTNCLKRYCLIKQSPKTVRPGGSTISQERTSHRLSGPPQQDLQCCTPWQREGRRSGLTATSTWGSPQGNGNQNEDVRRFPQRVRQVLSHVRIITTCTLPVIWYPGGAARWQREELDATERYSHNPRRSKEHPPAHQDESEVDTMQLRSCRADVCLFTQSLKMKTCGINRNSFILETLTLHWLVSEDAI